MPLNFIGMKQIKEIVDWIGKKEVFSIFRKHLHNGQKNFNLKGFSGSSFSLHLAALFNQLSHSFLIVEEDKEKAAYLLNDLENVLPGHSILFFPSSYKRSIDPDKMDTGSIILRTEVLNKLSNPKDTGSGKHLIVTYPEALCEKIISFQELKENTLILKVNEELSISFITEVLETYRFERVDFVFEPGQYSIRGSIVDIFSFSHEFPYRVDFFGDTVDSIRTFEVDSQLSKTKLDEINIIPNIQIDSIATKSQSITDFLTPDDLLFIYDIEWSLSNSQQLVEEYFSKFHGKPNNEMNADSLLSRDDLLRKYSQFTTIEFGQKKFFSDSITLALNIGPQPGFSKNFELFIQFMQERYQEGFHNFIFTNSEKQIDRLDSIFTELGKGEDKPYECLHTSISQGFIDYDLQLAAFTDHQLFERYYKYRLRGNISKKESINFRELTGLQPGDYVVHSDHGIGIFSGMARIDKNGSMQEVIRLTYQNSDTLLVSIHNLHRISRYRGKDDEPPKMSKLGGVAWDNLKKKTKSKLKDIARDLIALYAKRRMEEGFAFSPDSYLQNELEASFIYEDTPDQLKTTQAVKEDMESLIPMDRLVCGDVGFGKTEIAIRAAFKAATDGKQVAVLVPTTILAMQHYYTFRDRLKEFPVKVDYISRFRKPKDQKIILNNLSEGKLDILIGTHKLIGKDVRFKDLGLLIVDEEQKFGVSVKEKLKALKVNVDTLTLTATPIPRTLQFSMMGARDLSVINTPPPNRYPILTEVHSFHPEIIKQAIEYELNRDGQVFFIHNRVQNIYEVEALIKKINPKVKTVVGHGQMDGQRLEEVMLGFINGDYDVLIATTIIENGLDIPNANTIIINDAQNFGLSELHQLRGRVGRSNKKAFCYLMAPPLHSLRQEARRRLKAIEEFSELGSGFSISMQDLDIRGAGNLLGAEQSGFINEIGLETYQRILDEAMLELRETEFKDLFQQEDKKLPEQKSFISDCNVETDLTVLIPDNYISNTTERLKIYREIDKISESSELERFEMSLVDRFGQVPTETIDLLRIVRLRWAAMKLGIEKISLKAGKMICYFISNQESPFYRSNQFSQLLGFVQSHPRLCKLKETNDKLSLVFENIRTVQDAINLLNQIQKQE